MTPPIFNLDDEVIITGKPVTLDTDEFLGKRFTIDTIGKRHGETVFSDAHLPWYPASSLRLVEELKIGDKVRTVEPEYDGIVFEFNGYDKKNDAILSVACSPIFLEKIDDTIESRLSAIESSLNELGSSHAELMGDVEALAEKVGAIQSSQEEAIEYSDDLENITETLAKRIHGLQKRADFLEAYQKGEMPEVCEGRPYTEPVSIAILGNRHHTNVFKYPEDAMRWCNTVLDSMREG